MLKISKMFRETLFAILAVISHGMVDASQVCYSKDTCPGGGCNCTRPPPKLPARPSWCPALGCKSKDLVIAGCSLAIICIFVMFVGSLCLCIRNKTVPKPAFWIFLNSCVAVLCLYISLLVSVIPDGNTIANGFVVDLFLLASTCSMLVEAVAIGSFESIPSSKVINAVIIAVCCWILPLLKCIIIVAIPGDNYNYKLPSEYFLKTKGSKKGPSNVAIADMVLIALIFLATMGIVLFCLFEKKKTERGKEKTERGEIQRRVAFFSFKCVSLHAWVFSLLGFGLLCSQGFGIAFIICSILHGIAILVEFFCHYGRKDEFIKDRSVTDGATGLNQVSPSGSPRDSPANEIVDQNNPNMKSERL